MVLEENNVVIRDENANNFLNMRCDRRVVHASFQDTPFHAKPANLISFLTEMHWIVAIIYACLPGRARGRSRFGLGDCIGG